MHNVKNYQSGFPSCRIWLFLMQNFHFQHMQPCLWEMTIPATSGMKPYLSPQHTPLEVESCRTHLQGWRQHQLNQLSLHMHKEPLIQLNLMLFHCSNFLGNWWEKETSLTLANLFHPLPAQQPRVSFHSSLRTAPDVQLFCGKRHLRVWTHLGFATTCSLQSGGFFVEKVMLVPPSGTVNHR